MTGVRYYTCASSTAPTAFVDCPFTSTVPCGWQHCRTCYPPTYVTGNRADWTAPRPVNRAEERDMRRGRIRPPQPKGPRR